MDKVSKFSGALFARHGHLRYDIESRSQHERVKEVESFQGVGRGDTSIVQTCGPAMALLGGKDAQGQPTNLRSATKESGPDKTKRLDPIKPIAVRTSSGPWMQMAQSLS